MEDIILNYDEYKIVQKFQGRLESCYRVEILIPMLEKSSLCEKIVVGQICGREMDIQNVKDFIAQRVKRKRKRISDFTNLHSVPMITLSDSEEDSNSTTEDASIYIIESTSNSNNVNSSDKNSTRSDLEVSDDIVLNADDTDDYPRTSHTETVLSKQWCSWDSISNVAQSIAQRTWEKRKNKKRSQKQARHRHLLALTRAVTQRRWEKGKNKKISQEQARQRNLLLLTPSSTGSLDPAICEVTSTTEERENNACPGVISQWNGSMKVVIQNDSNSAPDVPVISYRNARSEQPNFQKDSKASDTILIDNSKKRNEEPSSSNNSNPDLDFVPIVHQNRRNAVLPTQNKSFPAPNFIPIGKKRKRNQPNQQSRLKCSSSKSKTSEAVVLGPETVLPAVPRRLRPIVIDGSNVACAHGNVSTFSSKGIQLCVEFFLKRGHKEITAFVPNFRRYDHTYRAFPTIDAAILEELAKKQYVVFTPSRRLNGINVSPYDDRFVVKLASENGGVIVSNDNFKDLVNESEAFKEAIEKRLLMFCFVGDKIMIPEDPLGQYGPKLDDYLSFPPEEQEPPN